MVLPSYSCNDASDLVRKSAMKRLARCAKTAAVQVGPAPARDAQRVFATQARTCVPTLGTSPAWQRWRHHRLHTKGTEQNEGQQAQRPSRRRLRAPAPRFPTASSGLFAMRSTPPAANRRARSASARGPRASQRKDRPRPATNPVAASVPTPSERVQPPLPQPIPPPVSAAEALRLAKAPVAGRARREGTNNQGRARHAPAQPVPASPTIDAVGRTQAVRGKPKVIRSNFHQDPVVGWLVVVGGRASGPIAQSMRATTRLAVPRRSAFPSTLAMIPSPRRSRLISATILSTARSCLFPTWPRPTLSRSTTKADRGRAAAGHGCDNGRAYTARLCAVLRRGV